ncbi:hypothetical protein C8R46DRAFT_404363 [Mycena filopes]|nr:hypothetical protein C8R46DRAFT_404363 [Mycena filopes]
MWSSLREQVNLDHRAPLSFQSFFHTFLPPVALYYITNVLSILPNTFLYRLVLLPITLFTVCRATVSIDLARSFLKSHPERLEYLNQAWVLAMFTVFTRTLARTSSSRTPQRRRGNPTAMTPKQIALDAADLTFNLRAYGWQFTSSMKVAAQTRPLAPTSAFLTATAKSLLAHIVIFDFLHYISQLTLDTIDAGGSIYDPTSDPLTRQLRATLMTLLVGLLIYGAIQIGHDTFCLVGVGIVGQSPAEWPPISMHPGAPRRSRISGGPDGTRSSARTFSPSEPNHSLYLRAVLAACSAPSWFRGSSISWACGG